MQKNIFDTISRISNGYRYHFSEIHVVNSFFVLLLLKFLYSEGFIRGFSIKKQTIIVFLKYYRSGNALNSIFCLSKPSKRFYLSKKEIVSLSKKKDFFVILTSKGFFSNRNIFDSSFSGGEVFCVIT
jgi:ribosomal protein S8